MARRGEEQVRHPRPRVPPVTSAFLPCRLHRAAMADDESDAEDAMARSLLMLLTLARHESSGGASASNGNRDHGAPKLAHLDCMYISVEKPCHSQLQLT